MKIKLTKVRPQVQKRLLFTIMKTYIFLLCTTVFSLTTENSFSQEKIIINKNQLVTVDQVFRIIKQQANYHFIYPKNLFKDIPKVQLKKGKIKITELLDKSLSNNNFNYKLTKNNTIVIEKIAVINIKNQQQKEIRGTVSDKNGHPLPGANIIEKGTTNGIITDFDGNFSIKVTDENAVLVVSYVGFITREITLNGQTNLTIVLKDDVTSLEEIVFVGYGTQNKVSVVGSISSIGSESVTSRPTQNIIDVLQGQIPGLVITRGNGQPGSGGFNIRLRGVTSVTGNGISNIQPLTIIDGVQGNLNDINPEDVDKVTVLKDAAAAIYGARAGGGVLLITTKNGKKSKMKISYSSNYSIKTPTLQPKRANPKQYMDIINEGRDNRKPKRDSLFTYQSHYQYLGEEVEVIIQGSSKNATHREQRTAYLIDNNIDNIFWDNGIQQTHNLSLSGGSEKQSYFVSLGVLSEEGLLANGPDDYERYNLRMRYNIKLNDNISLETNTNLVKSKRSQAPNLKRIIASYWGFYSSSPLKNPLGQWYGTRNVENPIYRLTEGGFSEIGSNILSTNFSATIKILKDLKFVGNASLRYNFSNTLTNVKTLTRYGWTGKFIANYYPTNPNSRSRTHSKSYNSTLYGFLQYKKNFGNHHLTVMGGGSHEENDWQGFNASRNDFFIETEPYTLNLGDPEQQFNRDFGSAWAIRSGFGRLSYDYDNKYFAEVNLRYDGSSRFHPDQRWGFFKGVLASWRISKEDFFDVDGISELKLRLSYGESGNQSNIGLYDYISTLGQGRSVLLGSDNTLNTTIRATGVVSKDRSWEVIQTQNIGLDATLFDNRLDLSFDYFIKTNTDLLVKGEYAAVFGAEPPSANLGTLRNWGWEANINWKDNIGNFYYAIGLHVDDSKNKLISFGGNELRKEGSGNLIEGYPVGAIFGYKFVGLVTTEEQLQEYKKLGEVPSNVNLGSSIFADLDGDGALKPNGDPSLGTKGDLEYLGQTLPRYNFGANFNFEYKGFDLNIFLQGVGKRTIYRNDSWTIPLATTWNGVLSWFYRKTWSPQNTEGTLPTINNRSKKFDYRASSLRVENGAYLRLKNVQFGYTLSNKYISKLPFSSARIYFSGKDLWETFDFKGAQADPETGGNIDFYPFARNYSFGLQLTF